MQIDVTIGWTNSDRDNRIFDDGYSSFSDGYRPGAHQHTETITIGGGFAEALLVADAVERIADAVFEATNAPSVAGLAAEIAEAIEKTGYRGREAHYSLSVGDTVTVNEVTVACARSGWERVTLAPALS